MAARLGEHLLRTSLEQSLRLKTLVICPLSALFFLSAVWQWPTFDCYPGNSLIHLMLNTAFGLPCFGPKVTGEGGGEGGGRGSLYLTKCPVGFDHNTITHLNSVYTKYDNSPNTQNRVASRPKLIAQEENLIL